MEVSVRVRRDLRRFRWVLVTKVWRYPTDKDRSVGTKVFGRDGSEVAYSRMTAGSGSWPRVVRVMAAVRISAPPAQA